MIATYSRNGIKKTSILQNAHNIVETVPMNAISTLTFDLPLSDLKLKHCSTFDYVRNDNDNALYRIIRKPRTEATATDIQHVECEHVFCTLLDTALPGTFQYDNLPTAEVIRRLLALQNTKDWVLGDCEFTRYFSYSWSHENVAKAIFQIPQNFDTPYIWEFDTSVYPWVVHLRVFNQNKKPEFYAREGKNLLSLEDIEDGAQIYNRIYAFGYGEGINQLTFDRINNGKKYVENRESINKYGLHETIWVDRRFDVEENLLQRANVLLDSYAFPRMSRTLSVADIEKLTGEYLDTPEAGKIIRSGDETSYIIEVVRHIDVDGQTQIKIANSPIDAAGTIADLADRALINQDYAQGNTFLYPVNFTDNADPSHPAVLQFFVPAETKSINKAMLTYTLERFRAYSTAAASGGGGAKTSSSGGATTSSSGGGGSSTSSSGGAGTPTSNSGGGGTSTSNNGGGGSTTSNSGGGGSSTAGAGGGQYSSTSTNAQQSRTSSAAGQANVTSGASSNSTSGMTSDQLRKNSGIQIARKGITSANDTTALQDGHFHMSWQHYHEVGLLPHNHSIAHTHTVTTPAHTHSLTIPAHNHTFTISDHTHNITFPAHSHTVSIPAHNHSVTIPAHSHTVSIPSHTHNVTIPAHTHTIGSHTHTIDIPAHSHPITYGIYEGNRAGSAMVQVDGVNVGTTGAEIDIVQYLKKDGSGNIQRGTYHTIRIIPDALTRISATLSVQMFIQTEGGGNY